MKTKHKAFTLIESIIVMVILATSLSGTTYLMMTVTDSIAENRKRITAIYMTQECMELTRNLRDSAWKQNLPWSCAFEKSDDTIENNSVFRISVDTDSTLGVLSNRQDYCRTNFGVNLEKDPSSFKLKNKTVFNHQEGSEMIFSRKLTVSEVKTNSAKFTCETSWKNRDNLQKISMSQILTNWK